MNKDEQLKKLKAFVNDLICYRSDVSGKLINSLMNKHGLTINGKDVNWLSEKKHYKVSLHNRLGTFYTLVVDNDEEAREYESYKDFVRWLTDWQEYEV